MLSAQHRPWLFRMIYHCYQGWITLMPKINYTPFWLTMLRSVILNLDCLFLICFEIFYWFLINIRRNGYWPPAAAKISTHQKLVDSTIMITKWQCFVLLRTSWSLMLNKYSWTPLVLQRMHLSTHVVQGSTQHLCSISTPA